MKTGLAWLATSVTGTALAGPAQALTHASAKLVMAFAIGKAASATRRGIVTNGPQ